MACCCCSSSCHSVIMLDLNRSLFVNGANKATTHHFCSYNLTTRFNFNNSRVFGYGFELQRKDQRLFQRRRFKFVISAELFRPFSVDIGLDSQVIFAFFLSFSHFTLLLSLSTSIIVCINILSAEICLMESFLLTVQMNWVDFGVWFAF